MKILLALFFALTLIQILPLPPSVIKLLSPNAFEIFRGTGQKGWLTLSLSPHLTAYELLKYICYFLFGYLVFRYVRSRPQIEIFVWVMMAGAVFQSLYGLAEFFGGTHRIFGWKNVYYYDSAFGTFVNRNHFAGFLEMTLLISIGCLLAKADFFALKKGLSIRDKILWFSHERLQKTILFGIAPVIIGIGLFFSRSRGGVFNFFVSILFMITAISWTGKRGHISGTVRDQRSRTIIRTIFVIVVSVALLIGVSPLLLERFSPDLVRGEGRPVVYENTIEMMGQFPLFGTGPGTYVYAYPKYEKTGTSRLMDHAHNDYLELLAESGAIAGGCLLLSVFGTLIVLLGRWTKRRDYFVRGITIGCLAGIVAILVHSVGDFNLRIPANAIYFISLFALAMTTLQLKNR
ncbi:MAG: O-antigen ligase family protein [Candidatus Aminicenantes bacterium]|nr:O-antigen ligase family protein [Candidatus Aminicenantes bacterium]